MPEGRAARTASDRGPRFAGGGLRRRLRHTGLTAATIVLLALPPIARADAEADLWAALQSGGHVALVRHALAPGTSDPAGFRVDDCTTQRNLSAEGREQARALGARFRANGVTRVAIYSSQWCRCLETARLLDLGPVTPFAGLNSFFADRSRHAPQSAEVRALIRARAGGPSLVLVTHQLNINALTGVFPGSGEIVVLRPVGDDLQVVGRIP
jgi:phosphohistidine phosphatase SixA